MSRYKRDVLKTVTIDGQKFEISVTSDGEFTCHVGGDYLKADRLVDLRKLMQRSVRKAKVTVAIPAMVMGVARSSGSGHYRKGGKVTCHPITIIGIDHAALEVKYRYADGTMASAARHSMRDDFSFAKPMTPEQVKEWHTLRDAKHAASDAFRTFVEKHEWRDIYGDTRQALADAADDPKEAPEPTEFPVYPRIEVESDVEDEPDVLEGTGINISHLKHAVPRRRRAGV